MQFTIHADGGARGNPGPAGAGVMIRDASGNSVASVSQFLGKHTNNFAEYEAVILGLETLKKIIPSAKQKSTNVIIKMDSELVVRQMRGEYKVKNKTLKEQQARLAPLIATFKSVLFTHVPRSENSDADSLANAAMDRGA